MLLIILYAVSRAITPAFTYYRVQVASWASHWLQQPIEIGAASAKWHGFEPIIELSDVAIYNDARTHELVHVGKIKIGFNLFDSIYKRQVVLRTIQITGLHLEIQKNAQGQWLINGMSNWSSNAQMQNAASFSEFLSWLASLHRVELSDVAVNWYDPNGKLWSLNPLAFKLEFVNGHYQLQGQTLLAQAVQAAQIEFTMEAWGDLADFKNLRFQLNVHADHLQAWPIIHLLNVQSNPWFNTLNTLQPRGEVRALTINYQGTAPPANRWQVLAKLQQAGWNQDQKIPGVQNLSGELQLQASSGQFQLDSQNVQMDFGDLFRAPLLMNQLQANIVWQLVQNVWQIKVTNLNAQNTDLSLADDTTINLPVQDPSDGTINSTAHFKLSSNAFVHVGSYLPLPIMPAAVTQWLNQSIKSGDSATGTFVLRGPWQHFPFKDGSGEFLINSVINNLTLDYWPGWPVAQHLSGEFIFNGPGFTANVDSGEIDGVRFSQLKANIPDLANDTTLSLQDQVQADLANAMHFINASPLQKTIGKQLQSIQFQGPMQLNLQLTIPLSSDSANTTQVAGVVQLQNGVLNLPAWKLHLNNLQGQLQFTQQGYSAQNVAATLFGKPLTFSVNSIASNKTTVVNTNSANSPNLAQLASGLNNNTAIAKTKNASTKTKKAVSIATQNNSPALSVNSANSITGTHITAQGSVDVQQLKDYLPVKLLAKIQGITQYAVVVDVPSLAKQAIHLLITSKLQGVAINLPDPIGKKASQAANFSLESYFGSGLTPKWQIAYNNNITANLNFNASSQQLSQVNVHFAQLTLFNQALGSADVQANRMASAWQISVNNPNANGLIIIPDNYATQGIQARFATLKLRSVNSASNNTTTIQPSDIPPLNLSADLLTYGAMNLGRMQLQLQPQTNGLAITRLDATTPSYTLHATGTWLANQQSSNNVTRLQGNLISNNLAATLLSWGFSANLSGKKSTATFDMSWPDAPYNFKLATIQGKISLALSQGMISDIGSTSTAKMDIGRLLSVLSLQTIARRLQLDFSDLTAKGFSYDTIQGDFYFSQGLATTNNTLIQGPIAHIQLRGDINLNSQTYNLNVHIIPQVTSSFSLPLIATVAGGPIAGIIALAANRIISPEVQKIAAYNYYISGPWSKPIVKELANSASLERHIPFMGRILNSV